MNDFYKQMATNLADQSINDLINRKSVLDNDYHNNVISYVEYEYCKMCIQDEIESLLNLKKELEK